MSPRATEQPDETVERIEVRRMIEKRIDDLPEAFRVVFMLRALEEMTVEETAACLGIPDATARTRYFRAKGLLRESLSRDIDFALEDAFSSSARVLAGRKPASGGDKFGLAGTGGTRAANTEAAAIKFDLLHQAALPATRRPVAPALY